MLPFFAPPDDSAYGFDNISDALGSPSLQEHYLSAALKIGALAVGDPNVSPGSETYRVRQDLLAEPARRGVCSWGPSARTMARHIFLLDGEYDFQVNLYRTNLNIVARAGAGTPGGIRHRRIAHSRRANRRTGRPRGAVREAHRYGRRRWSARSRVRVPVQKAGTHTVTAAFVQESEVVAPLRLQPFLRSSVDNFDWSGWPYIQNAGDHRSVPGQWSGRYAWADASGFSPAIPQMPPPRNRCAKQDRVDVGAICAYRQPVSAADLDRIMSFYADGRREGNFESGIETALQRILASPKFVFRIERDPENAPPGATHRIRRGLELRFAAIFLPVGAAFPTMSCSKLPTNCKTRRR